MITPKLFIRVAKCLKKIQKKNKHFPILILYDDFSGRIVLDSQNRFSTSYIDFSDFEDLSKQLKRQGF